MDNFNMANYSDLFYNTNIPIYVTICVTLCIAITYWLFYIPCNWIKKSNHIGNEDGVNLSSKRSIINRMRKIRANEAEEIPPPYPNGWFSIMESSNLKQGEAKNIFVLGEHLVVYRTQENKVYAINAYCPHMGANLGINSKIIGDTIECPFHQWRFRGSDGKCVNIPYSNCVPLNCNVRTWITQEANDNIFLWYHAEAAQEPWPLPIIEEIENKKIVFQGRNEFYVNCHIQEIPENGADLAHFAAVHRRNFVLGKLKSFNNFFSKIGNHYWETKWAPAQAPNKHLANLKLKHIVELIPNIHILQIDVVGEQIGPSYVQLHMKLPIQGNIEVLQTVTPIEPLLQKVVHRFYAPRIFAPITKIIIFGESIMFERDMTIWNNKVFRKRPLLPKEDTAIKSFRNWYSQFYSENSRTFKNSRDIYEW